MTLYTASGNAGRKLTLVRTDNTIANAVTIDGNGAETIRGATTYKMYSQYESVTIVSDGTNWYIERQYIPGTRTTSTITVQGVSSNPTKHTMTTDVLGWHREGKYAVIHWQYHGAAAGAAGSGEYKWMLPTGLSIDTAVLPAFSGTVGNASDPAIQKCFCGSGWIGVSGGAKGHISAFVTAADEVRFVAHNDFSSLTCLASSFYAFTSANYGLGVTIRVPISGWEY